MHPARARHDGARASFFAVRHLDRNVAWISEDGSSSTSYRSAQPGLCRTLRGVSGFVIGHTDDLDVLLEDEFRVTSSQ
jgi:hypothetical protein